MRNYMVFDIGGTSIKSSVINEEGKILTKEKLDIADNIDGFFQAIVNLTNSYKEEYNLEGIAISAPGAVDSDTGVIGGLSAIPYIHGPNFKEILLDKTGLNVEIENDANCAALGECWLGSSKETNDSAFIVCGTGIGGAIVKDNKIHKGINMHGGEFGYCIMDFNYSGDKVTFSTWSGIGSTVALAKNIADRKGVDPSEIDGIKAFDLANEGDKIAIEEVNKYFMCMAVGIYNIQYNYDPEVIVLGGAICDREDYLDKINEQLDIIMSSNIGGRIKPVIRKCEFGNDSNKLGALYNYLIRN